MNYDIHGRRLYKAYNSSAHGQLKWKSVFKNFGIEIYYSSQKNEFQILEIEADQITGERKTLKPEDLTDRQLLELEKVVKKHHKK